MVLDNLSDAARRHASQFDMPDDLDADEAIDRAKDNVTVTDDSSGSSGSVVDDVTNAVDDAVNDAQDAVGGVGGAVDGARGDVRSVVTFPEFGDVGDTVTDTAGDVGSGFVDLHPFLGDDTGGVPGFDLDAPDSVDAPSLDMPDVPDFSVPDFDAPDFDLPDVEGFGDALGSLAAIPAQIAAAAGGAFGRESGLSGLIRMGVLALIGLFAAMVLLGDN